MKSLSGIRAYTKALGIRLAVDYLCGLPGDTPSSVRRDIEALRGIGPDSVGVNSSLRLFRGIEMTAQILADPASHQWISRPVSKTSELIRPAFYTRISVDTLRDFIRDDPLFTIEGFAWAVLELPAAAGGVRT